MVRAIFVQGCARSGNTLMRELCVAAYQNTSLVKLTDDRAECDLQTLIDRISLGDEDILVASRNKPASLEMNPDHLKSHPEIGVVWMLRDPLDILTSKHKRKRGFYVEPERLISSLKLYLQFADHPQVVTVRYEDLVSKPDEVQAQIAARFGLNIFKPFSESYSDFPKFKQNIEAMHSIRPIDANSIGKWRSSPQLSGYLLDVLTKHPEIQQISGKIRYSIDTSILERSARTGRFWSFRFGKRAAV